jgi:hypothetical protein
VNFVYLLPFSYFFVTRLSKGSLAFHLIFEWLAAVVLVLAVGAGTPGQALKIAALSYLAFISLYEIGYLVNDQFAARKEPDGRHRGPRDAAVGWIVAWFMTRLAVFLLSAAWLDKMLDPAWWSFFAALGLVFALHNSLTDRELKAISFSWLAWFRFLAPVIFAILPEQRLGVALGAAIIYSGFRLYGYLDSKGLLAMPGRQRPAFRLAFFLVPLSGVLALWPYQEARGFVVLAGYMAAAASLGALPLLMGRRTIERRDREPR